MKTLRLRIHLWACAACHKLHHLGERAEHSLHLAYFAGLSTGLIDYKLIAALCLVAGMVSLLPGGEE